jgi:N-acetyl sugar amidotransferase
MDTTDPDITFDPDGICDHCKKAERVLASEPYALPEERKEQALQTLVDEIKHRGKGKRYDCVIGLSGGVDSSYVAYLTKQLGLRPLAVHLDNGWNSELAVHNIENICKTLGIDLFTHVINWEEFKDLQLAFLRASTPDSELPSDHAINAILFEVARRHKIDYILHGVNSASESIMPKAWAQGYQDWKYIKSVHSKFGSKRLRTYPHYGLLKIFYFMYLRKIHAVRILDYVPYDKEQAKAVISEQVGWRNYGRKHCESNYTRIFQEYILPTKFGYDKRRAHYSSLIMAGQVTREEALRSLASPLYTSSMPLKEDIRYLVNKFGISESEFETIMSSPAKTIHDYPNHSDSWYYRLGRMAHRTLARR